MDKMTDFAIAYKQRRNSKSHISFGIIVQIVYYQIENIFKNSSKNIEIAKTLVVIKISNKDE